MNDPIDLLITGFGPYPRVRVNPTDVLARLLARDARWKRLGLDVAATVFETSYAAVRRDVPLVLEAHRPRACLHLGLAPRARWLRVETAGRANPSRLYPDRRGGTGAGKAEPVPQRLATAASAATALAAIRHAGLRARLSNEAGRYLCDTLYHTSLSAARRAGRPVLFVHVPKPSAGRKRPGPRFTATRLKVALMAVALALALEGRRRGGRLRRPLSP